MEKTRKILKNFHRFTILLNSPYHVMEEKREIRTVLLIDDDDITNFINRQLLRKLNMGREVHCITGGKEALNFIMQFAAENQGNSPDLILLDINMPGMDGFEFLEAYNNIYFNNRKEVKIIFLSTSSHTRDLEKIKNQFRLTLINKPLSAEKLSIALKEMDFIS